jgi:hypothetical protein
MSRKDIEIIHTIAVSQPDMEFFKLKIMGLHETKYA